MNDHDADFERYESLTLKKGRLQVEIEDVEREMALIRERLRGGRSSVSTKENEADLDRLTPTEAKIVAFINGRDETRATDLMENFKISNALANQRLSDLTKRGHIHRKDFGVYAARRSS